jgi:hypothetical protein
MHPTVGAARAYDPRGSCRTTLSDAARVERADRIANVEAGGRPAVK